MSQKGCRGNYIILLTDGMESCGGTPKTVADELRKLFVTNPERGVKTYVIGFGLDDASKTTLNEIAAAGGTGQAYFASNTEELVKILLDDIINSLVGEGAFSQSSATMSQEIKTTDDYRIYYTYFDYPGWAGHLEAYLIDQEDGAIGDAVTGWADCNDDKVVADAGCKITSQGFASRTIYTWLSGTAFTAFTTANVSTLKGSLITATDDINENGTANENADAETVINYVRNPGYDDKKYAGSRNPDWLLGDIWHSTPVVVTPPTFDFDKEGYSDFKASTGVSDRDRVIYVGANDGMLHAVNDEDGSEKWAYIPKCLLGRMKELKCGHRYMVDGPITVADLDSDYRK